MKVIKTRNAHQALPEALSQMGRPKQLYRTNHRRNGATK